MPSLDTLAARLTLPTVVMAACLAFSCTAHRMYRPVSVEVHPDYSLAFVELDDQGELWAPSQLDRALAQIERLNRDHTGVALVLFVHGWNADASPKAEKEGEGTVFRFRSLLARLNQGIQDEVPGLDVPVMGVYLSWRGHVSSVPVVREASFYNRRGAAERIAGAPATEAIYRVLTTLRENPESRSVLMGHSFGSMILERALSQAVVSALLSAPDQELVFPADLVVLLNPAGSASQTKQLVDILSRNRLKTYRIDQQGRRFERPLLVSFTSESDTATRLFFPVGMSLKATSKKFRDYGQEYCSPISNQRQLYTHTPGHLSALHSHDVEVVPKSSQLVAQPPPDRLIPEFLHYQEEYDPLTQQIAISFDGSQERFTIKRKPRALNDTPYWIMQVPKELIPNHSAVLTEDTFRLVETTLVLSGTFDAAATIIEREDGVRPVAVVPRSDGSALFLDRSRALYLVTPDSSRPVFFSCLEKTVDPSDVIGFHVSGPMAYAVSTTRSGNAAEDRCATDVFEFEVDETQVQTSGHSRFSGSECFSAATVDLTEKRALLSTGSDDGAELWVADLTESSPTARELLELPGVDVPTVLHFDASRRILFAAQGESGDLWRVDLGTEEPTCTRIEHDFGWPMAIAYAHAGQRLYVTDAKQRKIWFLDCRDGCRQPEAFLESDALEHPTSLAVGADGTLWLGDLTGQTLMAIAPDGSTRQTIRTLSGER